MFCGFAAAEDVDEDGEAIGGTEANGGDAGEGVEGRGGAEVDAAEDAVDDGRQDEAPERDVEAFIDATPEFGARDSAVAGEGVGAAGGGGKSTDAGEEEDSEDEEEEAEAAAGRASDGFEEEADRLAIGDGEEHAYVGKDEEDRD